MTAGPAMANEVPRCFVTCTLRLTGTSMTMSRAHATVCLAVLRAYRIGQSCRFKVASIATPSLWALIVNASAVQRLITSRNGARRELEAHSGMMIIGSIQVSPGVKQAVTEKE